jgi:hypothetical protein
MHFGRAWTRILGIAIAWAVPRGEWLITSIDETSLWQREYRYAGLQDNRLGAKTPVNIWHMHIPIRNTPFTCTNAPESAINYRLFRIGCT